jgi:two-component system, NtrC family, response regulator AtoC
VGGTTLIEGMEVRILEGLTLLVVDDDELLRKRIVAHLDRCGADVMGVGTVEETRRTLTGMDFDFALLDIHLPDGSGLELLRRRGFPSGMGVIVMTGEAGVATAVEAMRLGAADYLVKPFEMEELPLVIERACRNRQRARLDEHQRSRADDYTSFFFGESLAELERLLAKIIESDTRVRTHLSPVLIQGETGTGKTTIARWLHHRGPRANRPLVEMNCSALPEALAESELFGHERGAFTDAHATRIGLFEASQGGTLFLDELPSLSMALQAKLLKAIEDQRIRRVGGRKEVPVDVRIIAATSVALTERVAAGQFREDLLHRLDLFRVVMPPLRDRGDDLLRLAERLLTRLAERHRLPGKRLSKLGQQRIRSHQWPGNVRELANELERAFVFEEGDLLDLEQLKLKGDVVGAEASTDWLKEGFEFPEQGFVLESAIGRLIQRALKQAGGNVSGAARLLGVTRDYLRYRLAEPRGDDAGGGDPPKGVGQ